jgi:hypothetical protein
MNLVLNQLSKESYDQTLLHTSSQPNPLSPVIRLNCDSYKQQCIQIIPNVWGILERQNCVGLWANTDFCPGSPT